MRSPDLRFVRRDIKEKVSTAKSAATKWPKFPSIVTIVSAGGAAACTALCVAVWRRSTGISGIVSDGKHAFDAGGIVHDQALWGIFVSALSFVAIMVGHLLSKHMKIRAATFSAAFVLMSVVCLAMTVSTYRQFG